MAPFRGPLFSQAPAWLPPWLICSPLCSDLPAYETPAMFASSCKDVEELSLTLGTKTIASPFYKDDNHQAHPFLCLSEEEMPDRLAYECMENPNFEKELAPIPLKCSQPKPLILQLSLSSRETIPDSNLNHEGSLRNEQSEKMPLEEVEILARTIPQDMYRSVVGATTYGPRLDPWCEMILETGISLGATEGHNANNTGIAGKSVVSPVLQHTVSTEQYIPSVQQLKPCKGNDVRLNLQSKRNLESCLKRPVENHLSAIRNGKKVKINNSKLSGENVKAAIGLTVASAETLLIADVIKSCPTCQDCGPTAILDAALNLKRGREMCGLDDFTLESVTCEDPCDDNWIEGLDDLSLEEEYLNAKQLELPSKNHFNSACMDPNIGVRKICETIEQVSTSFGFDAKADDLTMANNLANISFQHLNQNQACIGGAVGSQEIICVSPTSVHIPGRSHPLSHATFQCSQSQPQMAPNESFCSRWLGGWTGKDHEVEQQFQQVMAGADKRQIFLEFETSNLSEPCELIPVDIVQRDSTKLHEKGSLSFLASVKENNSKRENGCGTTFSAESCAEILMAMSQASAVGSSSALQEPLCSFVPCSIAANKTSPSTKLAGSGDHGVEVVKAINSVGDVIDSVEVLDKSNGVVNMGISLRDLKVKNDSTVAGNTVELGGNSNQHHPTSHQYCNKNQMAEHKQDVFQAPFKDGVTRRHLNSLKSYSTSSFASLLEAVSLATERQHLQSSPKDIVTPKIAKHGQDCLENQSGIKKTIELATDMASRFPNSIQVDSSIQNDVSNVFVNKGGFSDHREDLFQDSDLQDSPPLTWHRGKRRRLRACRIVDSALIQDTNAETLSNMLHDQCPLIISNGMCQKVGNIVGKDMVPASCSALRKAILVPENSNPTPFTDNCLADKQMASSSLEQQKVMNWESRSSKIMELGNTNITNGGTHKLKGRSHPDCQHNLFKGFEFLLTGFSAEKMSVCEELGRKIEEHSGVLLSNVPIFSTFYGKKTRRLQQMMTRRPIIIAPQQVRTTKFLYGCAVGSLIVKPNWIDQCITTRTFMSAKKCKERGKNYHHTFLRCEEEGSKALFDGIEVLLHGQQDYCSKLATLVKHGGGQVLRGRNRSVQRKNVAGSSIRVVVVEHQRDIPRNLKHSAASHKLPVVSGDWIVGSLLEGRLLPLPAVASKSILVCAADPKVPISSIVEADGFPPKKIISHRRKLSVQQTGCADQTNYIHATSDSKKQNCTELSITFFGKGTKRPALSRLDFSFDFLPKYCETHASSVVLEKFLHYKKISIRGIIYSAGDIIEIQPYTEEEKEFYVGQIESFYSDRLSTVKARSAKVDPEQELGKQCFMCCRWFYRPSDTGFPCLGTDKELYTSQHFDDNVPVQNIVKKVVLILVADRKIFTNHNDMGWKILAEGSPCSVESADYVCRFFYDHKNESLHQLKSLLRS